MIRSTAFKTTLMGIAFVFWSALALAQSEQNGLQGDDITCTGQNLMPQMAKDAPDIAAGLKQEAAATPNGDALLWKVASPGRPHSYIFGTMHISDPRLLALNPQIKRAFADSEVLALEITEILDPAAMASKAFSLLQYTSYGAQGSLDDVLETEDARLVETKAREKLGLPWSVARKMRPWALMGSLALPACELQRKRKSQPFLDLKLGQDAQAAGKQVVALETLESQMTAMASLPESFAVNGLLQSVRLGSRMDDLFETMTQLYLQQDIATIWALMRRIGDEGFVEPEQNQDYAEFQRIIVDARNASMVESARPLLEKGGAFVAIGALHLPGDKGIISLLREIGYTVTAVRSPS